MGSCEHCGGTGVLNVVDVWPTEGLDDEMTGWAYTEESYQDPCHACAAGGVLRAMVDALAEDLGE